MGNQDLARSVCSLAMQPINTETAIIGGGQAGVPLARALSAAGRPVVLFERAHLGGSCVNYGCTPSKALIASARLAADAKYGGALGILADVKIDFPAVMDRARRLAHLGAEELARSFETDKNILLMREPAQLESKGDGFFIRASDSVVRAERVILDTGNRTARPPISGLLCRRPTASPNARMQMSAPRCGKRSKRMAAASNRCKLAM
jgi:pyruvate/2-oxoglutarate dehydrogenase complex dihydrolipoamide dehydrogenase (E3) component